MSHDFAKSRKSPKKRAAAKKKPAAKPVSKRSAPKPTVKVGGRPSAMMWFAAIGATVFILIGLVLLSKFTPRPDRSFETAAPKEQTQFDFFTTLPEAKIDIAVPENDKPRIRHEYMLQTGSFRQQKEAEKMKGELAFLGYQSHISEAKHNGSRWFRVQIGPLNTRSEVAAARSNLFENGVDTMVFKTDVPIEEEDTQAKQH